MFYYHFISDFTQISQNTISLKTIWKNFLIHQSQYRKRSSIDGIGYEFADWGRSQLNRALGQTFNSGLFLPHVYQWIFI